MICLIALALNRGIRVLGVDFPPTNPNNCNTKYKDLIKPQSLTWLGSRKSSKPETANLHNFMKLGIVGNHFSRREVSSPKFPDETRQIPADQKVFTSKN
jgi:hypothetical protein